MSYYLKFIVFISAFLMFSESPTFSAQQPAASAAEAAATKKEEGDPASKVRAFEQYLPSTLKRVLRSLTGPFNVSYEIFYAVISKENS